MTKFILDGWTISLIQNPSPDHNTTKKMNEKFFEIMKHISIIKLQTCNLSTLWNASGVQRDNFSVI